MQYTYREKDQVSSKKRNFSDEYEFKQKVLSPEQIGIKLGRLGSYDILLPSRLDAIFLS